MTDFKLVPSTAFLKDLKKLPHPIREKVWNYLQNLKQDPYAGRNISKLSTLKIGIWRLRMGDYRLRYDIYKKEIRLYSVKHRKDIYRDL